MTTPDFDALAREAMAHAPTEPPPPEPRPEAPPAPSNMELFTSAGRAAVGALRAERPPGNPRRTAAESLAFVRAGRAAVQLAQRPQEPRRGTQRARALAAVRRHPGRTSSELTGLDACPDRYLFARRLPELLPLGLVRRERDAAGEWRWWAL